MLANVLSRGLAESLIILYKVIEYTLPPTGIKLKTLDVIGTDCIGRCKSNYVAPYDHGQWQPFKNYLRKIMATVWHFLSIFRAFKYSIYLSLHYWFLQK